MSDDAPNLDLLTAYWKAALGISSKTVVIYRKQYDMPCAEAAGSCDYQIETDTALIRVCHPSDHDPATCTPMDIERVLVHELLHIPFEYFKPSNRESMEFRMWEQAIEKTALALVTLNRGERPD